MHPPRSFLRRFPRTVTAVAAASLVLAATPVAQTNLLTNGSFEAGPVFAGYLPLTPGSGQLPGWTVVLGEIDLVDATLPVVVPDGQRVIDLNGSPGNGGVEQSFATDPGRAYIVRFAFAANTGRQGTRVVRGVDVTAAGQTATFWFDTGTMTNTTMVWETVRWSFTATSSTTTLHIASRSVQPLFLGPMIDDIAVFEGRLGSSRSGCPGSLGTPTVRLRAGTLPALGSTAIFDVAPVPLPTNGGLALLWFGTARPSSIDLSRIGAPGCALHLDAFGDSGILAQQGNVATWTLPIPNDPALAGIPVELQTLIRDPAANALGIATGALVVFTVL